MNVSELLAALADAPADAEVYMRITRYDQVHQWSELESVEECTTTPETNSVHGFVSHTVVIAS